ncbi:M48 family metallopeptidase [Sphaerisporangium sp. NPDC051011]|uniref:M48 family metallopeptidase n=1 Tax=Sphaerisporangium sp. NPDC051011 TaxID=3155792 RepID=UPI003409D65F
MTTPPAVEADGMCPSCSAPLSADPRFVIWCPSCSWNLDPSAGTGAVTTAPRRRAERRREARRRADGATVEQVFRDLANPSRPPAVRDGSWFAAMAVAGSVHLVTAAFTVGSIGLLTTGNLLMVPVAAIGLGIAFVTRPRLGRLDPDGSPLSRSEAPHLYALADRVAAELGAPPAELIEVTPGFGMSHTRVGLRRHVVLTIGLALWEVLTPEERVAALAHEFGHAVNGDPRRALWFHSAVEALTHWNRAGAPGPVEQSGAGLVFLIMDWVAKLVMRGVHHLTELLLRRLLRLTLAAGHRAEYHADEMAARVASSAATGSMLRALVLGDSVETVFRRRSAVRQGTRSGRAPSRDQADASLWQELREYVASIPEVERLRRLRLSARRMSSVDRAHPPTYLRVQLIGARPPAEAALTLDPAETAAIEEELTPARTQAARVVMMS